MVLHMDTGHTPHSSHPPPYWRCQSHAHIIMEGTTPSHPLRPPPPPHLPLPHSAPPPHAPLDPLTPLATTTPTPKSLSVRMIVRMSRMRERLSKGVACCQGHRVQPPMPPRTASLTLRECSQSAPKAYGHLHKWCLLIPSLTCCWDTSLLRAVKAVLWTPLGKSLLLPADYCRPNVRLHLLSGYHHPVHKKESTVSATESHASTLVNSIPVGHVMLCDVM